MAVRRWGSCAKCVLASARWQVDRKSVGSESAFLDDMCLQMGSVNCESSGSMWGEGERCLRDDTFMSPSGWSRIASSTAVTGCSTWLIFEVHRNLRMGCPPQV